MSGRLVVGVFFSFEHPPVFSSGNFVLDIIFSKTKTPFFLDPDEERKEKDKSRIQFGCHLDSIVNFVPTFASLLEDNETELVSTHSFASKGKRFCIQGDS